MLKGMSYRFRIPFSLVVTALFTALVIGLVIIWHTYENVKIELVDKSSRLSFALASAVLPALLHNDVWQAYNILRGPPIVIDMVNPTYIILDKEKRIFASSKPKQLPVAVPLVNVDFELDAALESYDMQASSDSLVEIGKHGKKRLLIVTPITSDGEPVGSLLLTYPGQVLWPRFFSIVLQGGLSTLLLMMVIIPIGWIWGRKIVEPVSNLTDCMARMQSHDLEHFECHLEKGDDEIGRLNAGFHELLEDLREKSELERQMVSSERLAAVGRLASGVAHEINNPLGGMLLAIDTLHKRNVADTQTKRTLALLERGLKQIQETVSALLVEARYESHALTAQDIEDTRTLISVQMDKRNIRMTWDNRISEILPLPSTLVRQVVINILLNAVQFTPQGGHVKASFVSDVETLSVLIQNEGEVMDKKTRDHLFEPYFTSHKGGTGLGLWVSYQIVKQLGGEISVDSQQNVTCFRVVLPFMDIQVEPYAA
ncbi:MAG: two-component sensor histidine kinase [Planctomycetia bacterium]|nr:two-component sensor histidine kinase [Planctomycetia bacterium]